MFVSMFHIAPQVVWLSICKGSLEARSKKTAKLSEMIIDSSATTPEVPFWTKCQPWLAAGAAVAVHAARRNASNLPKFLIAMEKSQENQENSSTLWKKSRS